MRRDRFEGVRQGLVVLRLDYPAVDVVLGSESPNALEGGGWHTLVQHVERPADRDGDLFSDFAVLGARAAEYVFGRADEILDGLHLFQCMLERVVLPHQRGVKRVAAGVHLFGRPRGGCLGGDMRPASTGISLLNGCLLPMSWMARTWRCVRRRLVRAGVVSAKRTAEQYAERTNVVGERCKSFLLTGIEVPIVVRRMFGKPVEAFRAPGRDISDALVQPVDVPPCDGERADSRLYLASQFVRFLSAFLALGIPIDHRAHEGCGPGQHRDDRHAERDQRGPRRHAAAAGGQRSAAEPGEGRVRRCRTGQRGNRRSGRSRSECRRHRESGRRPDTEDSDAGPGARSADRVFDPLGVPVFLVETLDVVFESTVLDAATLYRFSELLG